MITLFLLSSFVEAKKHKPKQGLFARMNVKRHAAAKEAARVNAERHELAKRMRAKAADLNARRHAAAAALRGEQPQG